MTMSAVRKKPAAQNDVFKEIDWSKYRRVCTGGGIEFVLIDKKDSTCWTVLDHHIWRHDAEVVDPKGWVCESSVFIDSSGNPWTP